MSIRESRGARSIDELLVFESHLDQMEHVRSILWAMKSLLAGNRAQMLARSTHYELMVLAAVGIRLADDLIDEMRNE